MVYLDVYNSIFEYLEDIGIVDDVFEFAEEIIDAIKKNIESSEMRNDIVVEIALFNYIHEDQLLIDFLSENLYPELDEEDKKDFDLIKNSSRFNLRFIRKEKIDELDTKGKSLYYFHFQDLANNEPKVIVSSSALDEPKHNINARLIKHPYRGGKFSIIGGIFDDKTYEAVSSYSKLKSIGKGIDNIHSHVSRILEFSKTHSAADINAYNEKSAFLEQDKEIMKINRRFFEKFGIGFDDFLKDFMNLSNSPDFCDMAEYYASITDELQETMMDTNYSFPFDLLSETIVRGFAAFLRKDKAELAKCISKLKEQGRKEFEDSLKNEISLSREHILKNSKKFLKEQVSLLKPKGIESFLKKIDAYPPGKIKDFLSAIVDYLGKLDTDDVQINFFAAMTKGILEEADNIPYLKDVEEQLKEYRYDEGEFYGYMDIEDNIYDLLVFLLAADLAAQKPDEAYDLLKEENIEKTESFQMMFLTGKIFSFFDDEDYKHYFNQAKKTDKERYKNELNQFLEEKSRGVLIL